MKRLKLYVCPVCGNVIMSAGEAVISCCGVTLPALEAETPDEAHMPRISYIDGEYYVEINHEMSKTHYISFIACVTGGSFDMVKLYPEGNAQARFALRPAGEILLLCNRHGLMKVRLTPPARKGGSIPEVR